MRTVNATFNYTNRLRIERDWVEFAAKSDELGCTLEMTKLSIDHLQLPGDARLMVEVRTARRRVIRFDAGTISQPMTGRPWDLLEPSADGISINLKVVEPAGNDRGKILAACLGLKPQLSGKSESLLAIVSKDLGERVWNLNFEPDSGPVFELNSRLHMQYMVWNDPVFISLTMPAVVKAVALWLVRNRDVPVEEPVGQVVSDWKRLFMSWGYGLSDIDEEDEDEVQNWANEVSGAFSARHRTFDSFIATLTITEE